MIKKFFLALLCLLLLSSCALASEQETEFFPEFETLLYSGETITSEIFSQTEFTLVKFWATWCGACRSEMSEYHVLLEDEELDVQILGVLMDDLDVPDSVYEAILKTSEKILTTSGITEYENYHCVLPYGNLSAFTPENIRYFPTTCVLSSEGEILYVYTGAMPAQEVKALLLSLAEE